MSCLITIFGPLGIKDFNDPEVLAIKEAYIFFILF